MKSPEPNLPSPQLARQTRRPTVNTVVRDGGILFRSAKPVQMLAPFRKPN